MSVAYRSRRRIVVAPPTTDKTIVFPYNFSSRKFVTQHYFPGMTGDRVPTEEINQFLAEVESQLASYHKATRPRIRKFMILGLLLVFIAVIVTIPVSIITMFSSSTSSQSSSTSAYSGYGVTARTTSTTSSFNFPIAIPIVVGVMIVYLITFVCVAVRYSSKANAKLREVIQGLHVYIGQKAPQFKSRGLTWVIPIYFPHWIELWKDDSMTGQPNFYAQTPQSQYSNGFMHADSNRPMYARPDETMSMMQPMQMQTPQQGIYIQGQYGANTYNKQGMYV